MFYVKLAFLDSFFYDGLQLGTDSFTPEIMDRIKHMKMKPDDVVLLGYPKSGEY